jgi:hypothetical protein
METLTNEEMLEIEGGNWLESAGSVFCSWVYAFAML